MYLMLVPIKPILLNNNFGCKKTLGFTTNYR
jgi:hypothetical protein